MPLQCMPHTHHIPHTAHHRAPHITAHHTSPHQHPTTQRIQIPFLLWLKVSRKPSPKGAAAAHQPHQPQYPHHHHCHWTHHPLYPTHHHHQQQQQFRRPQRPQPLTCQTSTHSANQHHPHVAAMSMYVALCTHTCAHTCNGCCCLWCLLSTSFHTHTQT